MEKESPGKESMEEDHWGGLGLKRLLHQRRRKTNFILHLPKLYNCMYSVY
jgi:hypothetical protein